MPSLSPRSHARDGGLAAKPTQENGDYRYLMMNGTLFTCRSSCGAQAWPVQATGAALPNGSSKDNLRQTSHSPAMIIGYCRHRVPTKHRTHSRLPGQVDPRPRSGRTINAHKATRWATV